MEGKKELVKAAQEAMESVEGQTSGYVESLPQNVQKRIEVLRKIQKEYNEAEMRFLEELHQLEAKYDAIYRPIFDKRGKIVRGEEEVEGAEAADPKGIPEFWFTALMNVNIIGPMVEEHDEPVLKHLIDVRHSLLPENPGFKLEFEFSDNEFFTNRVLSKTYVLQDDKENGDQVFDHSEGCEIDWKPDMNVTVEVVKKTQKKKGTKQKRVVTEVVPRKSFFDFFTPPQVPEDGEDIDEDMIGDLEMRLEEDYAVGSAIKEKLIPRAVLYFTGEAVQEDDDYDMDDEFEGEEDEDEEGDEDDEEGDEAPAAGGAPQGKPEECKQQ